MVRGRSFKITNLYLWHDFLGICDIHAHTHPAQTWREMEAQLFELKIAIPIYFAIEDPELEEIHNNLVLSAKKEKTATAVEGMGWVGKVKGQRYMGGVDVGCG